MRRLGVLGLVAGLVAWGVVLTPTTVLAEGHEETENTTCNGTLGAITVAGNLIVPAGSFCDLNGTHVTGTATIRPTGGLLTFGARIDGNVRVQHDGQFAGFSGTKLGDNIECNHCGVADLQDSTLRGSLHDNGVSQGAFIVNSHIGGSLTMNRGTTAVGADFTITGNSIGRDFEFNRNQGTSTISGNTVKGDLECAGNTPPPAGAGNTAEEKEGQCAGL